MHREAARATGISEEERQDYRETRTKRHMGCVKGGRCNNTVLCPTCSYKNWSKQREFFGLAWDKLTTDGYSWQSATVSIRYATDDEREYEVAAFRERIEVAQIVRRHLWEEHLEVPGAGLAYTIERGSGTRRDRGGAYRRAMANDAQYAKADDDEPFVSVARRIASAIQGAGVSVGHPDAENMAVEALARYQIEFMGKSS